MMTMIIGVIVISETNTWVLSFPAKFSNNTYAQFYVQRLKRNKVFQHHLLNIFFNILLVYQVYTFS
jgi:uncharacterized membrane protein YwzB